MPIVMKATRRSAKTSGMRVDVAKTIGGKLRSVRKAQGMTLIELAQRSGVDAATISRIETGRMTGTLESHAKLARALGVRLTEVLSGLEEARAKGAVSVQAASRRSEVYVHQAGKSSMAMLTSDVLTKKLMPVLITIEPGGSTKKEEAKIGSEKFVYVLEGTLEARVGEEVHHLKRGSTLYFEASMPHSLKNTGRATAKCLSVVTPPVL